MQQQIAYHKIKIVYTRRFFMYIRNRKAGTSHDSTLHIAAT